MFCPGCGTENPAQAAFCLKCGSNLSRFDSAQAFAAPPAFPGAGAPPAGYSGAPAASAPPSYLWGYIHGWLMLVASPLLLLLFLAVLLDPKSDHETRLGAIILMVLLALGALTGFLLVRKSRMGMILVFVWTGLHLLFAGICLLAIAAQPKDPAMFIALLVVLVGLAFWAGCSVYYYRNRQVFGG